MFVMSDVFYCGKMVLYCGKIVRKWKKYVWKNQLFHFSGDMRPPSVKPTKFYIELISEDRNAGQL